MKTKQTKNNTIEPGIRINKYLSQQNIATRKRADELVLQKKVLINGKLAVLGSRVQINDKVVVKENLENKNYVYYAYNKPINVITHSPQKNEKDIKENISKLKLSNDIFPVGRLDKNSHGLIILTNDGRITDKLLNPVYDHEKEYLVKTKNKLRSNFKEKMEAGVNIDPVRSRSPQGGRSTRFLARVASNGVEGYLTKKCKIQILDKNTFKIILNEGKKHQIRRMCSVLKQEIEDLKRIRILNIKIDNLKSNQVREIKNEELKTFLNQLFN